MMEVAVAKSFMKKAIIIFVRNPELGKVKTRLAKDIGDKETLLVYEDLLKYTHDIVYDLDCGKVVYYADTVKEKDLWENSRFKKKLQGGKDLGDRMKMAFFDLFEQGYSNVLIIGSDCPGLTSDIIEKAFEELGTHDVVIGPSEDGGYYLLGLAHFIPELFSNKQWSTGSVMNDTLQTANQLKKSTFILPLLYDIDTVADLQRYQEIAKK